MPFSSCSCSQARRAQQGFKVRQGTPGVSDARASRVCCLDLSTLDCVFGKLPSCLVADLENLIFQIFVISSLQSIRDSAPRGIIEDLRLIPDTRAGVAEGIPEGTNSDVRDPHLAQSETMWPHPNQNHNGCIKIEMAYACSVEKVLQICMKCHSHFSTHTSKHKTSSVSGPHPHSSPPRPAVIGQTWSQPSHSRRIRRKISDEGVLSSGISNLRLFG